MRYQSYPLGDRGLASDTVSPHLSMTAAAHARCRHGLTYAESLQVAGVGARAGRGGNVQCAMDMGGRSVIVDVERTLHSGHCWGR